MSATDQPGTGDGWFINGSTNRLPSEYVEYQRTLHENQDREHAALALSLNFYKRRAFIEREEQAKRQRRENPVLLTANNENAVMPATQFQHPVEVHSVKSKMEHNDEVMSAGPLLRDRGQNRVYYAGTHWSPLDPNRPLLATHNYEYNINLGRPVRGNASVNRKDDEQRTSKNNKPHQAQTSVQKNSKDHPHREVRNLEWRRTQGGMTTRAMARVNAS